MITKRYAHIVDEDRRRLADEMEENFYGGTVVEKKAETSTDINALIQLCNDNPELLKQLFQSVQFANKS